MAECYAPVRHSLDWVDVGPCQEMTTWDWIGVGVLAVAVLWAIYCLIRLLMELK